MWKMLAVCFVSNLFRNKDWGLVAVESAGAPSRDILQKSLHAPVASVTAAPQMRQGSTPAAAMGASRGPTSPPSRTLSPPIPPGKVRAAESGRGGRAGWSRAEPLQAMARAGAGAGGEGRGDRDGGGLGEWAGADSAARDGSPVGFVAGQVFASQTLHASNANLCTLVSSVVLVLANGGRVQQL